MKSATTFGLRLVLYVRRFRYFVWTINFVAELLFLYKDWICLQY